MEWGLIRPGAPATNRDVAGSSPAGRSTGAPRFALLTASRHESCRARHIPRESAISRLQRQGVPSRFIVIPDEGHWILEPQNSAFWYGQVLEWLKKYL